MEEAVSAIVALVVSLAVPFGVLTPESVVCGVGIIVCFGECLPEAAAAYENALSGAVFCGNESVVMM